MWGSKYILRCIFHSWEMLKFYHNKLSEKCKSEAKPCLSNSYLFGKVHTQLRWYQFLLLKTGLWSYQVNYYSGIIKKLCNEAPHSEIENRLLILQSLTECKIHFIFKSMHYRRRMKHDQITKRKSCVWIR